MRVHTATVSNIAATTSNVIGEAAATETPVSTQPAAKPAKSKKVKLSAVERELAKKNATYATVGDAMAAIGDEIGAYTADKELMQSEVLLDVARHLRAAMKLGLEVNMLKAPTKDMPRECYTILVDAINAPRLSAGMDELKPATRDNYLSRIRAFVKARGAVDLDLFGNLRTKELKAVKKAAPAKSTPVDSDGAEPSEEELATSRTVSFNAKSGTPENLIGLPALNAYMLQWLEANPVGTIAGQYRDMAVDMQKAMAEVLAK